MTDRAMACISAQNQPWVVHLSYIKPHWPYVAPAPYNDMYGPDDILEAVRDPGELENPHPVYASYLQREESQTFSRDEVRRAVIPVYMGMVRQIDDEIGRLMRWLEQRLLLDQTLVVFTSDHGDYLGDHWLGDKELFHRQSAQIPLIVVDPTDAADATRGSVCDAPVEAIDLVPTFIEWCGGEPPEERLEGASLLPWIRADADAERRSFVVSELDYSWRQQRRDLGLKPSQARAWMLRTDHWNYVYYEGFPPQLFDLRADPDELVDLGRDTGYAEIRRELADELFAWLRGRKVRATISEAEIERRTEAWRRNGVLAGAW